MEMGILDVAANMLFCGQSFCGTGDAKNAVNVMRALEAAERSSGMELDFPVSILSQPQSLLENRQLHPPEDEEIKEWVRVTKPQ